MAVLTPNEATLIGALGGAVLGGMIGGSVSFFVARYLVRHTANYAGQINDINKTLTTLAATQEEMKRNHAAAAIEEKARNEAAERRSEAARWKPHAKIESRVEDGAQVNELILKSNDNFFLTEASLIGPSGAKLEEYKVPPGVATTAFRVKITHPSLNKITSNNQEFFQTERFNGSIRYTVLRTNESVAYTGEIPFHGQRVYLQNTCYYALTG